MTKGQLEKSVSEKAQLTDVSLHSDGENKYAGTAKNGADECDVTVEVTRSRITVKAEGRPKPITREEVEGIFDEHNAGGEAKHAFCALYRVGLLGYVHHDRVRRCGARK